MEKFITLKEKDFQNMESGYNFILKNREKIYQLIQNDELLSKDFKKFFPSKKLKTF